MFSLSSFAVQRHLDASLTLSVWATSYKIAAMFTSGRESAQVLGRLTSYSVAHVYVLERWSWAWCSRTPPGGFINGRNGSEDADRARKGTGVAIFRIACKTLLVSHSIAQFYDGRSRTLAHGNTPPSCYETCSYKRAQLTLVPRESVTLPHLRGPVGWNGWNTFNIFEPNNPCNE